MAPGSAHKPRRKIKKIGDGAGDLGSVSQWEALPVILGGAFLFRWAAGFWGYSGFQTPPMYGDFEAQRHWMEITTELPISQWYFHDQHWWGLDYPPLTAYHSWLLGSIGKLINPAWFELFSSRGIDDPALKLFMRATVVVSEYIVFVPALVIFVRRYSRLSGVATKEANMALLAILMAPGLILIDHVHFQYNTVMLGFVVVSLSSIMAGRFMWASVFFVAALGFKQMALYYAPAIFAYLLGVCIFPKLDIPRFAGIAIATLASFALLLGPLYLGAFYDARRGISATPEVPIAELPLFADLFSNTSIDAWYYPLIQQTSQLLHRVFPFSRGLFEDKVANFWCALHVIHKLTRFSPATLQRASLILTLTAIAPPTLVIFLRPSRRLIPYALAATSWAFFLFGFQVHEKSVLLPLMPMTLLLSGPGGTSGYTKAWIGFANLLGAFTMFPLLARVELRIPYFVLTTLFALILYAIPNHKTATQRAKEATMTPYELSRPDIGDWTLGEVASMVVMAFFAQAVFAWHVIEAWYGAPAELPDLWTVANVGLGVVGFGICYLWCLGMLVLESGILGKGEVEEGRELELKKTI